MIAIRVGSESIVLPNDIKLSFEFIDSAFDFDIIPGSLAWNFDIPTAPNSKTLEFAHFIEIKNKARSYDAFVNLGGSKEIQGKLVIIRPGTQNYNCVFIVNGFSVDALEQKMKDIELGADELLGSTTTQVITYANTQVTKTYPAVNFNFPIIKNTAFYGDSNADWSGICNPYDGEHNTFLPNSIDETNSAYNNYNLVPQLYFLFVLKKIFSTFGYSSSGEIFSDTELKKLLCYSNYALDLKEQRYMAFIGLPTQSVYLLGIGNSSTLLEFSDETPDYTDPENSFNTTTHEYDSSQHGYIQVKLHLNFTDLAQVPGSDTAMMILLMIDGVQVDVANYTNPPAAFEDTFTFAPVYKEPLEKITIEISYHDITYNTDIGGTFYVDGDVEFRNLSYEDLNVFAKSIHYADCLPDITVKDWLRGWRTTINMKFTFDFEQKLVIIDFSKKILTAPSDDWTTKAAKHHETETNTGDGYTLEFKLTDDALTDTNFTDLSAFALVGEVNRVADLPTPGNINDLILVLNENTFWAVRLAIDNIPEWYRISDNYYPYVLGNGKTKIEHGFAPLLMRTDTLIGLQGIFPAIEHSGSSMAFSVGINDSPHRFLIWHGLRQDALGRYYPFASSQNRDIAGTEIGNLFFRYTASGFSFYNLYWKAWMIFLMTTESNFRLCDLNINHIFDKLFTRQKMVQHVQSVVKKLSVDFSLNGIDAAEVELCKNI